QILRWDGKSLRIWKSMSGYHTSFRVGDDIFVRERGVGLLRLVGDTLSLIPGGERFADEQVFVVDRILDGELLIATQKSGLFLHDCQTIRPFHSNADEFLRQHRLYHGAVLKTGHIVLGMLDGGGVMILNSAGRVVEHLTESKGLPDGWVNYVYVDSQGGLWIALNNHGLVRFDPLSSISKYDRRSGIEGLIGDMRRHDDQLYVATSIGLFRLPLGTRNLDMAVFDRIRGVTAPTGIVAISGELLVASHDGLFAITGTEARRIVGGTYLSVASSHQYPGRLYLGSETGIEVLQKKKDQSFIRRDLAHIGEEVYALIEDHIGNLWASARSGKIYYVEIDGYEARIQEYVYSNPGVVG